MIVKRDGVISRPDNAFSWLSAMVLIGMLILPLYSSSKSIDLITGALFLNGCFGIAMLWVTISDAPYSLKQVHWVFYVTNFAVAPLFQ